MSAERRRRQLAAQTSLEGLVKRQGDAIKRKDRRIEHLERQVDALQQELTCDHRDAVERELQDRLKCIEPVLRLQVESAFTGQPLQIDHEDVLRRNVAAHAFVDENSKPIQSVSTMHGKSLRKSQKGLATQHSAESPVVSKAMHLDDCREVLHFIFGLLVSHDINATLLHHIARAVSWRYGITLRPYEAGPGAPDFAVTLPKKCSKKDDAQEVVHRTRAEAGEVDGPDQKEEVVPRTRAEAGEVDGPDEKEVLVHRTRAEAGEADGPDEKEEEEEEEDDEDMAAYIYVGKRALVSIISKFKDKTDTDIQLGDLRDLFLPKFLADEDVMIPVDMQLCAVSSVPELLALGPRRAAKAVVKAKKYYDQNKLVDPAPERPEPMNADAWRHCLHLWGEELEKFILDGEYWFGCGNFELFSETSE